MSLKDVASALQPSPDVSHQDLKQYLRQGTSLSLQDQDRVKWVIEGSKLQQWLNSPKSRTLLINGNGDANETFSPTTFLTAQLLESLGNLKTIIPLYFFCSLHTKSDPNVKNDAASLMRSFFLQLLFRKHISWNLDFFLKMRDIESIRAGDLDLLRTKLHKLTEQLPSPTFLSWMIDGINYDEHSERRQGFLKVIDQLLAVMKAHEKLIIKLLLTSNVKDRYVKNFITEDEILTVPANIDGGRQGWNNRVFEKALDHGIKTGSHDASN